MRDSDVIRSNYMEIEMKIALLIFVCFALIGCVDTPSMEGTPTVSGSGIPLSTPPINEDDSILSNEYSVAERALSRAVLEKNRATIREGLKSKFIGLKIDAVKALAEMNDKSSVPNLVEALQANQGVIDGGSETQILQNDLNQAIIRALERLTGLEFSVSKRLNKEKLSRYTPFSSEEIEDVVSKSGQWQTKSKPKN